MPDLYLLFSHELTEQQKREAYAELGVGEIHYLPDNLKGLWSQIPPEIPEVAGYLQPIQEWLSNQILEGDYILIQGDFGATFLMVQWAFARNCVPIYATTSRKVIEVRNDQEIVTNRVFEHVKFRLYETMRGDKLL
ncbi:MAG: hypothetical protein GX075_03475 [Firmicutes bacterium]|nr:hypothetical protein [Bacillota bacterium]